MSFSYTEPENYSYEGPANIEKYIDLEDKNNLQGVAELLAIESEKNSILPENLARLKRRHHCS